MALSKYKPTELDGSVEFSIPGVTLNDDSAITISGKYPRIRPNFTRSLPIDSALISTLTEELAAHAANCGFQHPKLKALSLNAVQLGLYSYPEAPPDSQRLQFVLHFLLWFSLYSDALNVAWAKENNGDKSLTIKDLRQIHQTFAKIILKEAIYLEMETQFGAFGEYHALCKLLQGLVNIGMALVQSGEDWDDAIEFFLAALQYTFESNEWRTVSAMDEKYTLSTYHIWKMGHSGGDVALEAVVFADGIRIPYSSRVTGAFRRMGAIIMGNVGWVQDILGLNNGSHGNRDNNEILFRTGGCKGESLEEAVEKTCTSLGEELVDLVMIKQALVDVLGQDGNLLRYLDKVDNLVDGQNLVLAQNLQTAVKLTRDSETAE